MERWHRIETRIWESGAAGVVGPSALAVYLAVRAFERFRRGRTASESADLTRHRGCVVAVGRLAESTGLSRSTVGRALDVLETEGWIRRLGRRTEGGVRGSFVAISDGPDEPLYVATWLNDRDLIGHGDRSDDQRSVTMTDQIDCDRSPRPITISDSDVVPPTSDHFPRSIRGRSIRGRSVQQRTENIDRRGEKRIRRSVAAMKRSIDAAIVVPFPSDWQPIFDPEIDPPIAEQSRNDPPAAREADPRLPPKPPSANPVARRQAILLESARRKWSEGREGEYTGDEAIASWCYRFERELGFPDPEMRTAKQRRTFAALFIRRAVEWVDGDRAQLLRYIRETFAWWVEANRRKESFPRGLPSYAALLRQKPDGSISWFFGNWKSGGTKQSGRG